MVIAMVIALLTLSVSSTVILTHYSDAQCPCSARVPQDMQTHFLNNSDWENLIEFKQFFVGDLTKNISKCIHGEEECVAQRHFVCAQNISATHWLSFEQCAYGHCTNCTNCPAIEGSHCPCANYTTFPNFNSNDIMKNCAVQLGYDWNDLHTCGTTARGQHLMEISSQQSNNDGVTYGVDGLAPIYLDNVKIPTKEFIPIVCGPIPSEVATAVCKKLATKGMVPKACVRNRLAR